MFLAFFFSGIHPVFVVIRNLSLLVVIHSTVGVNDPWTFYLIVSIDFRCNA